MDNLKFSRTEEIADVFNDAGLKFKIVPKKDSEALAAGFHVDNGPDLLAYIIVRGEETPIAFRIFEIVKNISDARRARVYEACNILNYCIRYLKYTVIDDNSIQLEYDIPSMESGREAGKLAVSIFVGVMGIMDAHYAFLMKAIYTDEPLDRKDVETKNGARGKKPLSAAHPNTGMLN